MKNTKIKPPFREEVDAVKRKTLSILPQNDSLRKNHISFIELMDWYQYESHYENDSDLLGLYAVFHDELVRFGGFEWVELKCPGFCLPLVQHSICGFQVSSLAEVANLIAESPKSDATFSSIFFRRLIELYDYAPICEAGWHPLLDMFSYGKSTLAANEYVQKFESQISEMSYSEFVELVHTVGFKAWANDDSSGTLAR